MADKTVQQMQDFLIDRFPGRLKPGVNLREFCHTLQMRFWGWYYDEPLFADFKMGQLAAGGWGKIKQQDIDVDYVMERAPLAFSTGDIRTFSNLVAGLPEDSDYLYRELPRNQRRVGDIAMIPNKNDEWRMFIMANNNNAVIGVIHRIVRVYNPTDPRMYRCYREGFQLDKARIFRPNLANFKADMLATPPE